MIKDNLNLKEGNGVTEVQLREVLTEAYEISNELKNKLSKIKINIDGEKYPEVIEAIRVIFGDKYVFKSGNSLINYDMYCAVLNLIRDLGKSTSSEIL